VCCISERWILGTGLLDEIGFIFSLARVGKSLRREIEAGAATFDITAPQFHVLHRLWRGDGILTTELSKDICSDGGTITGLLDRLEAKDLIRRERSTQDRRAVRIFLTPAGRELQRPLMGVLAAVNAHALEGFTLDEQRRLLGALEQVASNLE
jgi:DNA-binding MarR family transcriptional regulator